MKSSPPYNVWQTGCSPEMLVDIMGEDTQFSVDMHGEVPVLRVTGDLDHFSTPAFRTSVSALIEQGHTAIVVDMSAVGFMDSSGMSGIIFAAKRLAANGGCLSLANSNPRVNRKLDIGGLTRMAELLGIYPTVEQAVEGLRHV